MAEKPILYSFRRCPYAIRARLALDASGQSCEVREVALRDKPPEMMRASAKATVPVLIDEQGSVIDESLDIMLWALRRRDPENWLLPERGDLDQMLHLIGHFDTEFKRHLDRYKYPNRFIDADASVSRSEASKSLMVLEEKLLSSPFLFGDREALADAAIAPFVRQFSSVEPDWFDRQSWPNVLRWLQSMVGSQRFTRVMRPLKPWTSGTAGIEFPFER
jgi:glutathione S-transferase